VTLFPLGLLVFVTLAAVYDLRERRVPNELVLACGIAGLVVGVVREGGAGLADSGIAMILGTALLFPAFMLGWIGAGDAKLAGALGAWLGFALLPRFLAATVVTGGLLSAGVIALDLAFGRRKSRRDERGSRFGEVPYALAIGAGAIVAFVSGGGR
jgi:prepilin peptidase CpaA